jgi:hypothetical protein
MQRQDTDCDDDDDDDDDESQAHSPVARVSLKRSPSVGEGSGRRSSSPTASRKAEHNIVPPGSVPLRAGSTSPRPPRSPKLPRHGIRKLGIQRFQSIDPADATTATAEVVHAHAQLHAQSGPSTAEWGWAVPTGGFRSQNRERRRFFLEKSLATKKREAGVGVGVPAVQAHAASEPALVEEVAPHMVPETKVENAVEPVKPTEKPNSNSNSSSSSSSNSRSSSRSRSMSTSSSNGVTSVEYAVGRDRWQPPNQESAAGTGWASGTPGTDAASTASFQPRGPRARRSRERVVQPSSDLLFSHAPIDGRSGVTPAGVDCAAHAAPQSAPEWVSDADSTAFPPRASMRSRPARHVQSVADNEVFDETAQTQFMRGVGFGVGIGAGVGVGLGIGLGAVGALLYFAITHKQGRV